MQMSQAPRGPASQIADAIWVGVPLGLRRLSAALAVSTVDGLFLAVRPLVGVLAVPLALGFGLVVGATHPGFEHVYTEALWLLLVVAVVGTISGGLGLYLTAGFMVGDLLIGEHPQWILFRPEPIDLVAKYGSLLLTYALLAMLAVGVPIAAKSLAAEFRLPATTPRALRAVIGIAAFLIVTGLLVWVWTQSAPLLVRPVFVWANDSPTVAAMSTSQEQGGLIVTVAVLAALGRVIVQAVLAQPIGRTTGSAGTDRMTELEDRFRTETPVVPVLSRMPLLLRLILRAAVLTAVLAGLYAEYWQAALTFGVLLFAQILTSPMLPLRLGGYARLMRRIPRLVRLIAVMIPVYLIGSFILPLFLDQQSFLPFLLLAVVAAVLMSLLSPQADGEEPR